MLSGYSGGIRTRAALAVRFPLARLGGTHAERSMISIRTLIYRLQKLGEGCGDGTPVAIDGMEVVGGIVRVEASETAELRDAVAELQRENRRLREAVAALSPPA